MIDEEDTNIDVPGPDIQKLSFQHDAHVNLWGSLCANFDNYDEYLHFEGTAEEREWWWSGERDKVLHSLYGPEYDFTDELEDALQHLGVLGKPIARWDKEKKDFVPF